MLLIILPSTPVSEVNEEDDICQEESIDQIPWPVLQFQSNLAAITSAPPLPDKKKKSGGTSSGQGSPVSNPGDAKKAVSIGSSGSSKESSPPTSLERIVLKSSDTELSNDNVKEEEVLKHKASPKSGLSRKSSILKIRAFFEKSHSEPRSEKKSNIAGTRKASSFRIRDGPRFYRSLEDEHSSSSSEKTKKEENSSPPKITVSQGTELAGVDGPSIKKETHFLSPSNVERNVDEKPSLPVKRSKSMKVYRGFDIRSESNEAIASKATQQRVENVSTAVIREVTVPVTCGVVLSKTPSVTYISPKDKLYKPTTENTTKPVRKHSDRSPNYETSLPLATSSLDRGKEQRFAKPMSHSVAPTTCGSLDRGVVESKITPTYVNVLMRNQVKMQNSAPQ